MINFVNSSVISCIIPTFNRATLLKEAIESVLKQTYSGWELLVIDNGSTDETEKVVNHFLNKDNRIRYFRNNKKGPSAARNYGVEKAMGQYIVFLDDDDICLPHRFSCQLKAIKESGREFVVSGYEVRDRSDNRLIQRKLNELKGFGAGFPSRWIITRSLFIKSGGFDEELFMMEDPELSYRVAKHEVFAYNAEVVTIMYSTSDSLSKNSKMLEGKILMMQKAGKDMHPKEAAWWYYVIAMGCYLNKDITNTLRYLRIASENDHRIRFQIAYFYAKVFLRYYKSLQGINYHILKILGNYRFPELVKHPLI